MSIFSGIKNRMNQVAPEKTPGVIEQFKYKFPPPTREGMPHMLAARKMAAQRMNRRIPSVGAFGGFEDGSSQGAIMGGNPNKIMSKTSNYLSKMRGM